MDAGGRQYDQIYSFQYHFDDRYRWVPTPKIEEAIVNVKAVFW